MKKDFNTFLMLSIILLLFFNCSFGENLNNKGKKINGFSYKLDFERLKLIFARISIGLLVYDSKTYFDGIAETVFIDSLNLKESERMHQEPEHRENFSKGFSTTEKRGTHQEIFYYTAVRFTHKTPSNK